MKVEAASQAQGRWRTWGHLFRSGAAFVLLAAAACPSHAQEAGQARELCLVRHKGVEPEHIRQACTSLINSAGLQSHDRAIAHMRRAEVYRKMRIHFEALRDYETAIAIAPDIAEVFVDRAGLLVEMGFPNAVVLADYNEAIRLDPRNATAYNNRAMLGGKDDASRLADLSTAIRLDPRHASYFNNRGYLQASRGNHAAAISDFSRAIKLAPKDPHYFTQRGKSYAELGVDERAINDFTRAIELAPHIPVNHYSRGVAYERVGKGEDAMTDFREALRLLPDYPDARRKLCALAAQVQVPAASVPVACPTRTPKAQP